MFLNEDICRQVVRYFPNGKRWLEQYISSTHLSPRDDGQIDLENKNTWYISLLQIYQPLTTYISNVFITQVTDLCLVFVEHLVESVVELPGDGVDLQLLPDDLVLQLVNPEIVGMMVVTGDAGVDLW